jgi:hypothetical protein
MIEAIPVLNEAMNGRPTERKAVGTIATFTVIPLAGAGIVAGGFLAPGFDEGSLILWAVGGGVLAAAVGLATVFAVYRLFGFRAVAGLAAFYAGAWLGLFIAVFLIPLLDVWAFLPAPVLGVLNAVFRPFARRPKPAPPEEPLKPGEWRRKTWD